MGLLEEARPSILRQYKPLSTAADDGSLPSGDVKIPSKVVRPPTSTTARSALGAGSSSKAMSTGATKAPLLKAWIELLGYPRPAEGTEMSEAVRMVLFRAMMAAWIGIVALSEELVVVRPPMAERHPRPDERMIGSIHPSSPANLCLRDALFTSPEHRSYPF
jgi:hypothetical protein